MKKLVALFLTVAITGCTDPIKAERVLSENGYTEIKTGDYAYFMCGKDDQYATSFTAKSPSGKYVHGAVCGGAFKGSTIRFE